VVRGKAGNAFPQFGTLFVTRGGKLNAIGSIANPIIFTSELDDINDPFDIPLANEGGGGRGLWGGVVILGKGRINRPDSEASGSGTNPDGSFFQLYEGLSDLTDAGTGQQLHRFGGNDNTDDSGALRFVSIRYSGKALSANKELNGLSLGGVGSGTTLEFVEVYANADDGFEIWGGAVNSRYLVSAYNSDELFDMDQGHEGKHQFWFGLQAITGDEGLELNGQTSGDSNVNVPGALPLGEHQIYNVTLIGEGGAGSGSDAMNTRSEYYGSIHNSVIMEFQGRDQVSSVPTYNGTVTHNQFFGNVGGNGIVDLANNAFGNPQLTGVDRGQSELLDPRPAVGSPVFTGFKTPPADGFFINAPYKGASRDALWFQDWTAMADNLHLAPARKVIVVDVPASATETTIVFGAVGNTLQMSVATVNGKTYQLQSATVLTGSPLDWSNEGAAVAGDGTTKSFNQTISGSDKYFRIQVN